MVECPRCEGRGEIDLPGTYDGRVTISPEELITRTCWLCGGDGDVSHLQADIYERYRHEHHDQ